MHQPQIRLNANSLMSGLLAIALLAQIVGAQTPNKQESSPIKTMDDLNEKLREAMLNRQRPQIPHPTGVGPLREGVAPKQDGQAQVTANANMRGQNAPARTIVVTTTADDGSGSLRQALANASNRDTIKITVTGTIALTSGELLIDKSVTIRGPGAVNLTVSGGGISRVFHITPNATVTISGLTIINGNAKNLGLFPANAGGGINSDHAKLTISNCVVSGNTADTGGGIFSNSMVGGSASLTIINSTISGNSANYGGGIFSGGGFANTGPSGNAALSIYNSTISGNEANFGGGIFNDGFAGTATLEISNSIVSNNNAKNKLHTSPAGGGIYNNGDSGVATLTLDNSAVSGNSVHDDVCFPACLPTSGGGIFNDGSSSVSPGNATLEVSNSSIDGNSADGAGGIENGGSMSLSNTSISGNSGGGMLNLGGAATLNNCVISGNDNSGILNSGPATLTLIGSTVTNNHSDFLGGGIYNSGATAMLKGSSVIGNTTAGDGGGIENIEGRLTLIDSAVSNNSARFGGGIDNSTNGRSAQVTLNNSTVSGNSAPGISNFAIAGSVTMTLTNSTISGNSSSCDSFCASPGGINNGAGEGSATLTLNNSTVSDNLGWGIFNEVFNSAGSATIDITNTILNAGASSGSIVSVDITGAITSQGITSHGYNLSSDAAFGDNSTGPGGLLNGPGDLRNTDPRLGPLKDNGGPTMTHALLPHSPAIDAGDPSFNPYAFNPPLLYDQRGPDFLRIVNGRVDIGAFESKRRRDEDEDREP